MVFTQDESGVRCFAFIGGEEKFRVSHLILKHIHIWKAI